MPDLFPHLPIQHPPRVITTDRHALIICERCNGSGFVDQEMSVTCWECKGTGGGIVLREIG